jgi:glycosyltransferase involved in cell wall biosynthesis
MRENPKYYLGIYPSSKAHYFTEKLARNSIFCIAASRFLEEFLSAFNSKVYYIPSGVDADLFRPALNNKDNKKVAFSWIGTFHKQEYIENIKFALDCFSILRRKYHNIYFDIVGDGIYRDTLKEVVNRFGDKNILLKGWIAPDAIPEYLNNIQIGLLSVVSNKKFNKAKSPTKLFEYMAMAKPTLSSRIGEAAEIIEDGNNGFLASTKKEFIEKMEILIKDLNLRQKMGQNARETVEKEYSLTVLGRQLYEILSQIDA